MSSNPYEELVPHEDADDQVAEPESESPAPRLAPGGCTGDLFSAATQLRVQVRKNEYVVTSKAVEELAADEADEDREVDR